MSRYIDASKIRWSDISNGLGLVVVTYKEWVDEVPTADVKEVVRCKDCKYSNDRDTILRWCNRLICGCVKDDFFCADGERREIE